MSRFCNQVISIIFTPFIDSAVHNVTNVLGIVSLQFMFLGKEVLISSKVASDHLRSWLRGEVTHYQCREAFSKSLNMNRWR